MTLTPPCRYEAEWAPWRSPREDLPWAGHSGARRRSVVGLSVEHRSATQRITQSSSSLRLSTNWRTFKSNSARVPFWNNRGRPT